MDIQIKSSRAILATDSAVKKLKELKSEESSDDSFLRMGVKPGGCSAFHTRCSSILKSLMVM